MYITHVYLYMIYMNNTVKRYCEKMLNTDYKNVFFYIRGIMGIGCHHIIIILSE